MSLVAAKYSATKIFLHIDENVYSAAKNLTPVILSDVKGACDRGRVEGPREYFPNHAASGSSHEPCAILKLACVSARCHKPKPKACG